MRTSFFFGGIFALAIYFGAQIWLAPIRYGDGAGIYFRIWNYRSGHAAH
jgi:hypothetical protein